LGQPAFTYLAVAVAICYGLDENNFEELPVALYGCVLFMSSVAWMLLTSFVLKAEGKSSRLAATYQKDSRRTVSVFLYALAIVIAFFAPAISTFICALGRLMVCTR